MCCLGLAISNILDISGWWHSNSASESVFEILFTNLKKKKKIVFLKETLNKCELTVYHNRPLWLPNSKETDCK